ncbi:MAG: AfsR/SARP family transcriptional regulator, partial [Acidimicrobiia bacterium]
MASSAGESPIEFRLLGVFEVASGGRVLEIGSPKQRRLLAVLVMSLNRPVTVDALLDALWPTGLPDSATSTLQSLVSRLRGAVAGIHLRLGEGGYVLEAAPEQVDARRFAALAGRGADALTHGDPVTAAALLDEALG